MHRMGLGTMREPARHTAHLLNRRSQVCGRIGAHSEACLIQAHGGLLSIEVLHHLLARR